MAPQTRCLIAFLVLMVWRFVFTGLRRRPLAREIARPQQRHNNVLEQGVHTDQTSVAVIAANGPSRVDPIGRKDRAKTYLRRIVALTGATRMGNGYVLEIGTTRFHVWDRYVRRLRDSTVPQCPYEETCFYSPNKGMPKAEEIATALLQLKNNPALFDKWATRNGLAFKADGQVFGRVH